jgi:hypothetical protein
MNSEQIVEKLAEYLSYAPYLTEHSPDHQYQRANQLALELAVWLSPELYKMLGQSITNPSKQCNPGTVICAARKQYAESEINPDIIIGHAPGAGKNKHH